MADIHEDIAVQCLGVDYTGWESVQIETSMQHMYATATLTTTEVGTIVNGTSVFDEWNFPPGSLVEIFATGTMVFSGLVYQYIPSADAQQHSVTLVCVTRTYNFTVSSVKSDTGQYQNTTDAAIIAQWAIAHAGVQVNDISTPALVPWFQIKQGATNFSESLRLIGPAGKMLFGDAFGNLILSDGKASRMSGALVQGVNILSMQALLQAVNWETIEVIGQSPNGTDLNAILQPKGIAQSFSSPPNTRYVKVIDQRVSNIMQAQARANWERNRSEGAAMRAEIVCAGWRDLDGAFWVFNQDVYVNAPWLHINCVLRAARVVFTQNLQQGTVTQLTLQDPRTVAGSGFIGTSGAVPCNSGSVWDLGFDAAEQVINTLASSIGNIGKTLGF